MGRRLRRGQGADEDQGCEQHSPHRKIMTRAPRVMRLRLL
jgi:hypothetical protein